MPKFSYQAINHQSKKISGVITTDSPRRAIKQLETKGLQVVALEIFKPKKISNLKHGKLNQENINLALHELATMLLGGVSIAESIEAQAESNHHPVLLHAFERISVDLRQGKMFADALKASEIPLPGYVIQLVKAGELTGSLGQSLKDAVAQMAYDLRLKAEIKNALIYPAVLVFSGIGAVLMMFIFVVPKFANLLENADQIPLLGYLVLTIGVWTNDNWLFLSLLLVGSAVVSTPFFKNQKIQLILLDKLSKFPLLGDWLIEAEIASWSKVLGTLLSNRIALVDALQLAAESVRIPSRRIKLDEVNKDIKAGIALSKSLENQQVVTATGCNLIKVGEKSGELSKMLSSLAELYDEAGKNRMKRVLTLIEPIAILLIGGVIGVIIMGIILAITSANDIAV